MSTTYETEARTKRPLSMQDFLRAEAAVEPDPVSITEPTKETQIIAIYGKGGIGKSFTLANLSYSMAQNGKRVLLIGCDPKSDTTSLLFGGKACPTIIQTSSAKKLAGEEVAVVPNPDLPAPIVATAWLRTMPCSTPDLDALEAFVVANVGRAPGSDG